MSGGCGSIFGNISQYIKVTGGDFIAVEGASVLDRLSVADLRMPYKQILKSRVILKPGQINYLLNHLGLGDNATFLLIKATYNQKSVIEEDNYIDWCFADDLTKVHSMAQLITLTGNSTHRIKQLYLTNPNLKYSVTLDVMVAIIDDEFSFFNDGLNQTGVSFTGLEYIDIKTHIIGESIVIYDKGSPIKPLIYLNIVNIETIERTNNILIIDDASFGTLFFQFITNNDAIQALSLLNYIIENPNIDIDDIDPINDDIDPIVYFYSNVGNTASGDYIKYIGLTNSLPYNTTFGNTFSTRIALGTSSISKQNLIDLLISNVLDNRDGTMSITTNDINIISNSGSVESISSLGTYSLQFTFTDIAQNNIDNVNIQLYII